MKRMIFLLILTSIAFAANTHLYEANGAQVTNANKTKGPKALFKKNNIKEQKTNAKIYTLAVDSTHIVLTDSTIWLELEKNINYFICLDNSENGFWKTQDFSYQKDSSCIKLNSGNYVKTGKMQYISHMGNIHTLNILVGMKYINFSQKEHSIGSGFFGDEICDSKGKCAIQDPIRTIKIDEILLVDTYKVTECEFVQLLWDSIPAQLGREPYSIQYRDNKLFWINKKKQMIKDAPCDVHDSAAVRVDFYQALIYANNRNLRDGLKPVYTFTPTDSFYRENASFNIKNTSYISDEDMHLHVEVNEKANGYRLPYYDEWMALANAYTGKFDDESLTDDSSRIATYAWFGVIEPDDVYAQFDKNNIADQWRFSHSCGEWKQKSRPVGMLKANAFGLYDMFGLVCEKTLLPGQSIFHDEVSLCKGGFLSSSADEIDTYTRCEDDGFANKTFQGLRLVRQIK